VAWDGGVGSLETLVSLGPADWSGVESPDYGEEVFKKLVILCKNTKVMYLNVATGEPLKAGLPLRLDLAPCFIILLGTSEAEGSPKVPDAQRHAHC